MAIYQCDRCGFGVRLWACRVVMALLACGAWVLVVCGAMLTLASSASAANTIYWSSASTVGASNLDGSGTASTFASVSNVATGLAFDTSGNLYVGDNAGGTNDKVDRVTPAGSVSPFVSSGLDEPSGLAFDAVGNLYIADYFEVDKAGPSGGTASGFGGSTNNAQGLAIDAAGNLYVADEGNNRILKIPPAGGSGSTFATGLDEPTGLAFDAAGNLYVANYGNGDITKIPAGGGPGSTFATGLDEPRGMAFDAAGNLYVANQGNGDITKIPPGGGTGSTLVSTGSQADFLAIADAPLGTGVPAISGADTVGQPLTCGAATWAADPPGGQLFEQPTSNAVAWQLNGAAVPGASGSSFTPTQPGSYTCSRTGSNQAGSAVQSSAAFMVSQPSQPAQPSRPRVSAVRFDDQQITLSTPSVCTANTSKLAVTLTSTKIPRSRAAKLKFSKVVFYIDKGVKHKRHKTVRTRSGKKKKVVVITYTANATKDHVPVTVELSLAGLKPGTDTLKVVVSYKQTKLEHGHKKSVTVTKTLKVKFAVC
jgi:sugar lactone lactonase YvrE